MGFQGSIDGTFTTTQPKPKYSGWVELHRWQGGWLNPDAMPIVHPPLTFKQVLMNEVVQWIAFYMMYKLNPGVITPKIWTALHDDDRVHTNYKGFDPDDPYAKLNYITGQTKDGDLPAYDKPWRLGGGQYVPDPVMVVDGRLRLVAGINGIDADTLKTSFANQDEMKAYANKIADEALEKGHFTWGLNGFDAGPYVRHFTQGKGGPTVFPRIFRGTIEFELKYFVRWEGVVPPNPLEIYYGN